jgi:predicted PurR-regulated permease PerM
MIPSIVQSATDIVEKITKFINDPSSIEFYNNLINSDNELIITVTDYINESTQTLLVRLGELSTIAITAVLDTVGSATSSVINFFLIFVIAIYMLLDQKDLLLRVKKLNYAVNKKEVADNLLRITHLTDETFSSFFIGKILDSAIVGVICFVLMLIVGIPNAPAIGFIIGVTNIIPYFGPFIGAVPAVLVTLASGSLTQAIIVIVLIVALQQFDGLYLGPKIIGDKIGVGAFWIIVSVTIGGALFGLIGMLIGVPLVVLIKRLVEEFIEKRLEEKRIDLEAAE